MKRLCLLLIISHSTSAFSRTKLVGIFFSPEYSYRLLTYDKELSWIFDYRNATEIPKFGYTIGVNYSFQMKKKFFFDVGVSYSNKGWNTKKSELVYSNAQSTDPVSVYYHYTYAFAEVPIKINYQFSDSNLFFVSLGLVPSVSIFNGTKSYLQYPDGSTDKQSSIHTKSGYAGISGFVGVPFYFKISKRLLLKTAPFFKCFIFTTRSSVKINEYPYSFGVELGLYFYK